MADVRKESEQLPVGLNAALGGRNRVERLKRSLVTESLNNVDAVVQQFGYDAVSLLGQGLERAYSAVSVPCLNVLARVSGVAATNIPSKDKESMGEKEAKQAEGRFARTQQGSAKRKRSRGSRNVCNARG